MHHDLVDPQPGTGGHFIAKGGQTLVTGVPCRCSQIDQVDIVGDDLMQAGCGKAAAEQICIFIADRLALPLVGGTGKDLQGTATGGYGPFNGLMEATGNGHMGAKIIRHG